MDKVIEGSSYHIDGFISRVIGEVVGSYQGGGSIIPLNHEYISIVAGHAFKNFDFCFILTKFNTTRNKFHIKNELLHTQKSFFNFLRSKIYFPLGPNNGTIKK